MQLKPFEAGRYDDESIVVRNSDNGKQEIFSEAEFEIVKFLKQNEDETLLALLLPNIGIAKKHHIVICLRVIVKLKKIQILDYFGITGKQHSSNTATIELEVPKQKLQFRGFPGLATALLTLGEIACSWLGSFPLLLALLILSAVSFAFFPFEAVDPALKGHRTINYAHLYLTFYGVAALALSLRSVWRAGFLRALGKRSRDARVRILFPFPALDFDAREINLKGRGARIQMGIVGLISPLALSAVFSLLGARGLIPLDVAFYGFSACVAVTLALACPFLPFDMADIIHVLARSNVLTEDTSGRLRLVMRTKGAIGKDLLLGLLLSFGWLLAWLDSLRAFGETLSATISDDLYFYEDLPRCIGAGLTVFIFGCLLLMPVIVFAYSYLRDLARSRRARLVVAKDKVNDSLSFEDRMAALERIPLFAYLAEEERLLLLSEMQTHFFE
ncbi:MAG: hypothetical protein EOP11_21380, partial [Proteobacteria bacterium]